MVTVALIQDTDTMLLTLITVLKIPTTLFLQRQLPTATETKIETETETKIATETYISLTTTTEA